MRAIDAEELKRSIAVSALIDDQKTLEQIIDEQPTIEERKKGKWTNDSACEFCGFQPWYERDIHTLNYCPNCGADMRGGQDERMDV